METALAWAAFVKSHKVKSGGIDLQGVTSHPSGFTFDLAVDEAQLGAFERDLVIGSIRRRTGSWSGTTRV